MSVAMFFGAVDLPRRHSIENSFINNYHLLIFFPTFFLGLILHYNLKTAGKKHFSQ